MIYFTITSIVCQHIIIMVFAIKYICVSRASMYLQHFFFLSIYLYNILMQYFHIAFRDKNFNKEVKLFNVSTNNDISSELLDSLDSNRFTKQRFQIQLFFQDFAQKRQQLGWLMSKPKIHTQFLYFIASADNGIRTHTPQGRRF